MKKLLTILAVVSLTACSDGAGYSSFTDVMQHEPGLAGCKAYYVRSNGSHITVVRCPAAETISTTTGSKNPINTVTVVDRPTTQCKQ